MSTPPNDYEVRPGYTTTEFWVHLLIVGLSAATSILAIVQPGFHLSSTLSGYIPTVAAILALSSQTVYTMSRHKLKSQSATNYATWALEALKNTAAAKAQLPAAGTPAVVINNHSTAPDATSSTVDTSATNSASDNMAGASSQVSAGGDLTVGGGPIA